MSTEGESCAARLARVGASVLIAVRVMAGLHAQSPAFDVASVKASRSVAEESSSVVMPGGRYSATNVTVRMLMRSAYGVHDTQIVGGPSWINTERFDIEAKKEGRTTASGFRDEARLMIRPLLADRFKLVVRREQRDMPVYALVFAQPDRRFGPQMRRSDPGTCQGPATLATAQGAAEPALPLPCGAEVYRPGHLAGRAVTLSLYVLNLARWTDRVVVDRTGLDGTFDWDLQWTPDDAPVDGAIAPGNPPLLTALREQAGFTLARQRAAVDVLVIEHVEPPDPD